jgi:hypothetical protein
MEHWFDRLAQPHTRRTALKAGALAGAMLVLPNSRLPQASATTSEPCFKPCVAAAGTAFDAQNANCNNLLFGGAGILVTGSFIQQWLSILSGWDCQSRAELTWHHAVDACRGSQCGDPAKYPGGQLPKPPPPKCTPCYDVPCGDNCCSIVAECCLCPKTGGYSCCAAGAQCDCCGA